MPTNAQKEMHANFDMHNVVFSFSLLNFRLKYNHPYTQLINDTKCLRTFVLITTWHLTGCGDADPHNSLKSASSA